MKITYVTGQSISYVYAEFEGDYLFSGTNTVYYYLLKNCTVEGTSSNGGLGNYLFIDWNIDLGHRVPDGQLLPLLKGYLSKATLQGTGNWFAKGWWTDDVLTGNSGSNKLYGLGGADRLDGMGGDDFLFGGDGIDVLLGGEGNDHLDGGTGQSTLIGGSGNDTYYVYQEYLSVGKNSFDWAYVDEIQYGGSGNDTLVVDFSLSMLPSKDSINPNSKYIWILGDVENCTMAGAGDYSVSGNYLSNIIRGNAGNNRLDGLKDGKTDVLFGGLGNDTYIIDEVVDEANEQDGGGIDTIIASVTQTLAENARVGVFEKLILIGISNINGAGNSVDNWITGNDGRNKLYGLGGDDTLDGGRDGQSDELIGGFGDDTYILNESIEKITEYRNGGSDTVITTVSFDISPIFVENVEVVGNGNVNITGNEFENVIRGGGGSNNIIGGSGRDNIFGNAGNDLLDGTSDQAVDQLYGGSGNDVYIVCEYEKIVEYSSDGTDTVYFRPAVASSFLTWDLDENVENIVLEGAAVGANGNRSNNEITGNKLANVLNGGDGNDVLTDNGGDDVLDGGRGADLMGGGLGSDRYWVDNIGDRVVEDAVEKPLAIARIDAERPDWLGNYRSILGLNAFDWVFSTIDYTLSDTSNIEVLALRGVASLSATGNNLDNGITGNGGNNTLKGLDGNDALWGGAGADILEGGDGDDWLDGGYGYDVLTGGAGRDVFDFGENFPVDPATGKVSGSTLSSSHDVVRDFVHGEDKIALSMKTFAAFAGHRPGDGIAAGQIRIVTSTEKWDVSFASDRDDYLIYDRFTGKLWYDGNGSDSVNDELGLWSGKRLIATFSSADGLHPQTLDHTDFMLIA